MSDTARLYKCLSYIDCQLKSAPGDTQPHFTLHRHPAVTISRQTGSGAHAIAELLAEYLHHHDSRQHCPWTVFDRNLVEKVLEDHHLPKRLAQYMPEDRNSTLKDIMEEILGLHPPSWTLFHQTTETILHLAEMGHTILVGRGACLITARLENVVHVRIVGSLERRMDRVCQARGMSAKEAKELILQEDDARVRYAKNHFNRNIDDPAHYHLIINTDRVELPEAAELIGRLVVDRCAQAP